MTKADVELFPVPGGGIPSRPPPRRPALIESSELTLRQLARTVSQERWIIAGVTAVVLALCAVYLRLTPPVYEASLLVQMEETRRTIAGLEDISALLSDKTPADTEISIMRSQRVIGTVVDRLALDISAAPERNFAETVLAGLGLKSADKTPSPADKTPAPKGKASRPPIQIAQLSVASELEDDRMILTAGEPGRFSLTSSDGMPLLSGTVGTLAVAGTGGRRVELLVSGLDASPGTRFVVVKRPRAEVVEGLQKALRISETGKNTGIVTVSLEGGDAARLAVVLNTFGSAYLRQNVERKSAEAEKTLAFLDGQLPELRANVARAESALRQFQTRKGTMSLSHDTELMLNRSVAVEKELSELELQRTEIRQRFTERHPTFLAVSEKIDQLRARRASVDGQLKDLPGNELEVARLQRDVRVSSQVYDLLLNKAQELRILRSGIVGNVRIVDDAFPPRRPTRPVPRSVLALGLLLGLAGGIAVALARRALDEGADDPVQIEARTGLPVYVTVPHSELEGRLQTRRALRKGIPAALAVNAPEDVAIESLRSLRTALQFALVEARSHVLCISSPAPAAGKSFISLNLSILLASTGKKVLLVDADLRRGRIHRALALSRSPGLSDFVSGAALLDDVLRPSGLERLDVTSTGRIPPNPAELLASHRFQQFLAAAGPRYDLIVVDTPPVLAVTDASLVARWSGVNLLVLRAGSHSLREVALAVKQFSQSGLTIHGAIMNDARFSRDGVGRYGRYYEYRSQPD